MRLISKSGFLLMFTALTSVGQTSFPTNDDRLMAITAVAIGRMCAEQKPEMNYSLQNLLNVPDRGVTPELKSEIAQVDADPSLQGEIMAMQIHAAGDPLAMKHLCPSYAPKGAE
ncbi:hypothetical protein V3H56_12740 [Pseudomonas sp. MS646]|uniref:Uncharacterized protein n=1 Tax=Pseudomonas chlororaphis TaxID=587753 RepID=A0A0G3GFX7_9PSED|nr:hypothetical protein VM99_18935 [Pseudomonas chlororaphis]